MSSVYLKQFRTYVASLQKLELEYSPTKADLLVDHERQRGILDGLGLGRSVNLTHKDKAKYYHEQLFRSHQMLLMDTATSEFLFLSDFFDTQGDHTLFVEVFGKTTRFFLDSLESFLANCWDS